MTYKHTRLLPVEDIDALGGAYLDSIHFEVHGPRRDILVDYRELKPSAPPQLSLRNGKPVEKVSGVYLPRRLRLQGVRQWDLAGLYTHLGDAPVDSPVRELRGMLFFRATSGANYCLLFSSSGGSLTADPIRCLQEARRGEPAAVEVTRDWSPTPASSPGLVPLPRSLYIRYGGDPVPVHLGRRKLNRRLFIGALDMQGTLRPQVDQVLNLGEAAPAWYRLGRGLPADRWLEQGEGSQGMKVEKVAGLAADVVDSLRRGKRVLVHCLAGMNRSATVCCAALMQLEGISAEAALERVRLHHPWARPDSHHWLGLRWLEVLWGEIDSSLRNQ